jgi:glycerophosphoryl diester phosphodiesterase
MATGRREALMAARALTIAHRGASADFPENTVAAFEEALRQGADGIELDVQLSRDGIALVHHDDRLPDGRRICELDAADVPEHLDSPRGRGHIPALGEVLAEFGRRTLLMVEIKALEGRARNAQLARTVVELIRRTVPAPDVMILSFDGAVLEACRRESPTLRRVWNLDRGPALRQRLAARLPTLFAVGADVHRLSCAITTAVHDASRALLVYTCNTEAEVDAALTHGATYVLSDRPAWLRGRLAEPNTLHGA